MITSRPKHFYDSAEPANIPTGVLAAVYVNGSVWPQSQINRMARVFRVSVLREAHWAQVARAIDIEPGAGEPADAVPFVEERRAYLRHRYGANANDDATVYTDRSLWPEIIRLCEEARIILPRFWIATLDGTINISEGNVKPWAVQYSGGVNAPFDVSVLLGRDDLH